MKRYFLVEIAASDGRVSVEGLEKRLSSAYRCTAVVEMAEVHFEARDGSTIHSDREMLTFHKQTVSAWIDLR